MADLNNDTDLRLLLDSLRLELSGYINKRLRLFKLDAFEKGSIAFSYIIYGLIVFIIVLSILFFFLFGLAFLLGDILGNNSAGFGILFGISVIALLIIIGFRKRIKRYVLMKSIALLRKIDANEEE
jgi:hypothetical protein